MVRQKKEEEEIGKTWTWKKKSMVAILRRARNEPALLYGRAAGNMSALLTVCSWHEAKELV